MKDHVVSHLSPVSLALYRIYRHLVLLDIYKVTLDFLTELWNSFEQISNKSIVRHLKDWSLSILVDGHNDFAVLHSCQVLNGPRDPHRNVQLLVSNTWSKVS